MQRVITRCSLALALVALTACGSGGGGGGSGGGGAPGIPVAPNMQVLPQSYDFGTVTTGNTPEPLEVTIRNVGNGPLTVGPIDFAPGSSSAFTFDFATAQPCGSGAFTVAALGSCTFRVNFDPPGNDSYTANVRITPSGLPQAILAISGRVEPVTALTVRINQVDTACPTNDATAYVSVTDQGGFTVRGLTASNFTVRQGAPLSAPLLPLSVTPLGSAYRPLAFSAALDNSGSVTGQAVAYAEMRKGFESFFNAMRGNDVGELINFGTELQVTVPFPMPSSPSNATNKAALVAGLTLPWTGGSATLLYDSVNRAIDDVASQHPAYRRAVIVATDGTDLAEGGGQLSQKALQDIIDIAKIKGVPVFAVGLGNSINTTALQKLASDTGGVFYIANTSQNLATIYAQLSALLFADQYVLTFSQLALGAGTRSDLRVDVNMPGPLTGNATSLITACN